MFHDGAEVWVNSSKWFEFKAPFKGVVTGSYILPYEGRLYLVTGDGVRVTKEGEEAASSWGNIPESSLSAVEPKADKRKTAVGDQD